MSDWDTVTYIGKRQNAGPARHATESEVNAARRSGSAVDTEKRCTSLFPTPALLRSVPASADVCEAAPTRVLVHRTVNAGTNRMTGAIKDTAKLDRETEELHRAFLRSRSCGVHSGVC